MSSDEEDYMSENFLAKCLPVKDIVPGLIKNHSLKRQHLIHKKTQDKNSKRNKILPTRVLEANRREEGLQVSIGSDNKGYALLQKMGYQPGQGIGKRESGIAEPISIKVKCDRFGLGRETVLKEISKCKAIKRAQNLQQREKECNVENYRKRLAEKAREKEIQCDLRKSQRMCKTLDMDNEIMVPVESWFWPEYIEEDAEEESSDEESEEIQFEPPEKLKLLTKYLRECHLYCIWCGCFTDNGDMESHCPGPQRDLH